MNQQRTYGNLKWLVGTQVGLIVFGFAVISIALFIVGGAISVDTTSQALSTLATTPPTEPVASEPGVIELLLPAIVAIAAMILVGRPIARIFGLDA